MRKQTEKQDELKAWLEKRFNELEKRISRVEAKLNVSTSNQTQPLSNIGALRPAWLNVLKVMKDNFSGLVTAEALAGRLSVNKSVASGYLAKLESLGLVKKKYNNTRMPGRYVFGLTDTAEQVVTRVEQAH